MDIAWAETVAVSANPGGATIVESGGKVVHPTVAGTGPGVGHATMRPMTDRSASPMTPEERAAALPCWSGPVHPEPLPGGITNTNLVVSDGADRYVVRIGDDLPLHGVMRHHEVATCVAAHACGLAPEIVHHEPGAMVMRFIDAAALTAQDIRRPETRRRVTALIRRCHTEMPRHLRGATVMFWVFQVCRHYLATAGDHPGRHRGILAELSRRNDALEHAVGPIHPVFCHNDLLAANILDDGTTLWLLDWEYAGWNSAFFDLANLASNNELSPDDETSLLEDYFDRPARPEDLTRFRTMKCASLLREALWSLVQEHHSTLDFDYVPYTDQHLERFRQAYQDLEIAP
jgi:thiamine kinase-like enzyme